MQTIHQLPFNHHQLIKNSVSMTPSSMLPRDYTYIENGVSFSLKEVSYPNDMPLLHTWMHMSHVIPQWKLNKEMVDLQVYFEKMLSDDHQRLYLVGIKGEWVGYTEIYEGARDRLAGYYDADINDLGWHLLLAEPQAFGKGYLRAIIRMLSFFIFTHSAAKKIVGEPDSTVKPYEVVAQALEYQPQKLIQMPEKTAMLYFCDKQRFLEKFADFQPEA